MVRAKDLRDFLTIFLDFETIETVSSLEDISETNDVRNREEDLFSNKRRYSNFGNEQNKVKLLSP